MRSTCLRIKYLNKRAWLILGFFFVLSSTAYGQDKAIADSLELVYNAGDFEELDRLEVLDELVFNQPDPEKALKYSEELLQAAQELDSTRYIVRGFRHRGTALRLKGDLSEALEDYFRAAEIATENKLNGQLGALHVVIADVYSIMGNHNESR